MRIRCYPYMNIRVHTRHLVDSYDEDDKHGMNCSDVSTTILSFGICGARLEFFGICNGDILLSESFLSPDGLCL